MLCYMFEDTIAVTRDPKRTHNCFPNKEQTSQKCQKGLIAMCTIFPGKLKFIKKNDLSDYRQKFKKLHTETQPEDHVL